MGPLRVLHQAYKASLALGSEIGPPSPPIGLPRQRCGP